MGAALVAVVLWVVMDRSGGGEGDLKSPAVADGALPEVIPMNSGAVAALARLASDEGEAVALARHITWTTREVYEHYGAPQESRESGNVNNPYFRRLYPVDAEITGGTDTLLVMVFRPGELVDIEFEAE